MGSDRDISHNLYFCNGNDR